MLVTSIFSFFHNIFKRLLSLYQTKNIWTCPIRKHDDKINVTEKLKFVLGRVQNILGKGESACYQHLLLFP